MAVFNFTVRATDSEGSYADRQFNITVRNSRVERFMALDATNAFTSPDGTTWTQRSGQGGFTCAYGNGFWLILKDKTLGTSALKSTDGINFTAILPSAQTYLIEDGVTTTTNPQFVSIGQAKLRFWNGRFWIVTINGSDGLASAHYDLWSTADGITWKRKRLLSKASGTLAAPGISVMTFSEDNGTFFIPFCTGINSGLAASGFEYCYGWSTTDGVTFTPIKTAGQTTSSYSAAVLTRINGVYLAYPLSVNAGGWTQNNYIYSTDGLNWTTQTGLGDTNHTPLCFTYANGQVYSFAYRGSVSSAPSYYTSTDALTWTGIPFKSFGSSGAIYTYSVYKNGIFLLASNSGVNIDTSATLATPNNGLRLSTDGSTWTSVNIQGAAANSTSAYTDLAAM
jgi:hypothetical protein